MKWRQLSDTHNYLKLKSDPTKKYKVTLTVLISKGVKLGVFDGKLAESLVAEYPVVSSFYHLLKTHQGLNSLHGRSIISGIGSLNERLGQLLDKLLQPLVSKLPSHLKDTNHLLNT